MLYFLFICWQGLLGRLAGNGFGSKWGIAFLPELLHSLPYGVALGYILNYHEVGFLYCLLATALGAAISYGGMQSATWMFLRWESHDDPNTERTSTLKPIIDFIAGRFDYKLGDEAYAWIAAGVKGFIIGLPVGGFLTAIAWSLGYEVGSHAKGRVGKFGLDPHMFSEFLASAFGAITIITIVQLTTGGL